MDLRRQKSLFAISLLILGWMLANIGVDFVHHARVQHSFCSDHGKSAHASHRHAKLPEFAEAETAPPQHEHCTFHFIQSVGQSLASQMHFAFVTAVATPVTASDTSLRHETRNILSRAPKTSPPTI